MNRFLAGSKLFTVSLLGAMLVFGACAPNSDHVGQLSQAEFVNGGFDNGLTGWTKQIALWGTGGGSVGFGAFPPTTFSQLNLTIGSGVDKTSAVDSMTSGFPIPSGLSMPDSLRYPLSGVASAVVNQQGDNHNANVLRQTTTMTAADVDASDGNIHIRFAAAPVLNNPSHDSDQQPYFFIEIRNNTTNKTLLSTFNFANQPGVGWHTASADNEVLYTDWQTFDVAPGPAGIAIGDQIEVIVVGSGCSFNQHWGEVYVDDFSTQLNRPNVKVTAPSVVTANSNLTYTITAKNGSLSNITGTVVDFATPVMADSRINGQPRTVNTTYVSSSAPGVTCTAPMVGATGTISCNVGTLAPGATYTFTVTVLVPTIPGNHTAPDYVNAGTYSIVSSQSAKTTGNLIQTLVSTGNATDLETTLTDGKPSVAWGDATTYTLTVKNNGPTAANGVTIVDSRPGTLSSPMWTCATGGGGGACGAAMGSGNISTTANLPVGGSVVYTIPTTATGGPANGQITYSVTATPPGGITQSVPNHNTGVDTNTVSASLFALTVNKTGSTGTGTLTSAPQSISCGPACMSASANFAGGTQVAITATPALGSFFNGFTGACTGFTNPCTVNVSAAATVTAKFDVPQLTTSLVTTSNGGSANLRLGDTADFGVKLTMPPGVGQALVVTDTFPAGLAYLTNTTPVITGALTCSAPGGCTMPTRVIGAMTTFDFGNVSCGSGATCEINFTITGRVAPTAMRGDMLVDKIGATSFMTSDLPTLTVIEPNLTVSRVANPNSGLQRGGTSTVTVTLANNTGGSNADAYDVVVTFPTPANATAGNYMAGTCPTATTDFTGGNAKFTLPTGDAGKIATGSSCTFTYQITVGAMAPGNMNLTFAAGTITSQSITGMAPPAKLYTIMTSTSSIGVGGLANGEACGMTAECASMVCDPADNKCGWADGDGPCDASNAGTVCRSGSCSATTNTCIAAGSCNADVDCTVATQFCNTQTHLCAPRIINGMSIPTITGHTPALTGACSTDVGTAVCLSSVCDTADNLCGYANDHGSCNSSNAATVCRAGSCGSDGRCGLRDGDGPCTSVNAATVCRTGTCSAGGLCGHGGCTLDSQCTSAQFCNTETNTCQAKFVNSEPIPPIGDHQPPLVEQCTAAVGAAVCASGVCDTADNRCGYAAGHGECTAANAATVCRDGNCLPSGVCAGPARLVGGGVSCAMSGPNSNSAPAASMLALVILTMAFWRRRRRDA